MEWIDRWSALAPSIERARAAHPELRVDPGQFAEYLAARGGAQALHVEDLYLAFACSQRDRAALRHFEERFLSQAGRWVARLQLEPAQLDELRQRLRERVLLGRAGRGKAAPRILDYSGRGPLGAWARVTAIREALDLIEREKAHQPTGADPAGQPVDAESEALRAAVDPELHTLQQLHLPQFQLAFHAALDSLTAQERNLLRFHFVDGLNIGRIGEIFGKSRATIGRMVIACRQKLLSETRLRMGAISGASQSEVRSLIRVLRSRLDFSIRGALREPGAGGGGR